MIELFHQPGSRLIEAESEPTVEAYMIRKNRSLGNNFKMESGLHSDSCALIAFDIAFSLIEAGRTPTIGSLRGREIRDNSYIRNETLVPRRFEGRVTFGGHTICICDGEVYDPMVSETPIPVERYLEEAFTNEGIEFDPLYLTAEYIQERLTEAKAAS